MQKYEIIDVIDEGAYGIVWKALNKETGGQVAIKEFKEGDEDQFSRKTIQRQIKMLKMLKSEFVIAIKEAFRKKGKIYLIFEYFECNLLNVIEKYESGLDVRVGMIQPLLINELIYKLVRCVRFLHSKNILHRDIKPQNILLDRDNIRLKLCDFGFARFLPEAQYDLTQYVATRWYRAPQLLVGQPYSKPVDMWAVGCIIGELVDAQPMFPGDDQVDQLHRIQQLIGDITPSQLHFLTSNPKFKLPLPSTQRTDTLDIRYLGKIQKNALGFMKACLKIDPTERMTVEQAFKHPYLLHFSLIDNQFANDQQNLLDSNRKLMKVDSKNLFVNEENQQKKYLSVNHHIQDHSSLQHSPLKQLQMKRATNAQELMNKMMPQTIRENQQILKKKSHTNLIKQQDISHQNQKNQSLQRLNKLISDEKNVKFNVDFNIKINLKVKQREDFSKRFPNKNSMQQLLPAPSRKLPEIGLKPIKQPFKTIRKQDIRKKNQLIGIIGQSKQLIKMKN